MADYLLIYQNPDMEAMANTPPEEFQRIMGEWNAWFKELEATGNLRNPGAALGPEGAVLSTDGDGIETDTTMSEVKELIGGYSVLQADSLDHANELAKGCPYLKNNPAGTILVRTIMEMG